MQVCYGLNISFTLCSAFESLINKSNISHTLTNCEILFKELVSEIMCGQYALLNEIQMHDKSQIQSDKNID